MSMSRFVVIAVVVVLAIGALVYGLSGYLARKVDPSEIALQLVRGRPVALVGPGIYTDVGFFKEIVIIDTEGKTWCAEDPEILTSDKQRIGLEVCGTVQRPGVNLGLERYFTLWSTYPTLYENDEALLGLFDGDTGALLTQGKTQELAFQVMKSCVGDRGFEAAIVGGGRDELSTCLEEGLNKRFVPFGMAIANITVPNVTIHPSVQEKLDQITNEKFQTQLERQEQSRIEAQAEKQLAEQLGTIRVEQGRVQEESRQAAITAELESARLEAELEVIAAQSRNDLEAAELRLRVVEALLAVESKEAEANLVGERLLAELYVANPEYGKYLIEVEYASAWNELDKVVLPAGTQPKAVISPDSESLVPSLVLEP